jgi:hypothetical protein
VTNMQLTVSIIMSEVHIFDVAGIHGDTNLNPKRRKSGRPKDEDQEQAFEKCVRILRQTMKNS